MVTRDGLKVLKLHSPTARAILRIFKTSLMPINHDIPERPFDFLYKYHYHYYYILKRICVIAALNKVECIFNLGKIRVPNST